MRFAPLLVTSLLLASPAFAQQGDRFDQLEQELMLLKRKVDRTSAAGIGSGASAPVEGGVGVAQTDVRLSALEEELRNLRGKVEEKDFETQRLTEELEKFKRDAEFRMTELEKRGAGPAPATTPATAPTPEASAKPVDAPKKPDIAVKEAPDEEAAAASPAGDTPRDIYNFAFRQLNQNQYDAAAKSFADFTKRFPKDPLVGNAYYWQGETFYIRKDFAKASDYFRQGYESMPKGPKSGDNLLKLGMSLAAMSKKEEACVVLGQVMEKYKASSANTAAKAQAEHKRNGCA